MKLDEETKAELDETLRAYAPKKTPHRFTSETARAAGMKGAAAGTREARQAAGRKGGIATASKPGHMAEMGRRSWINRRRVKVEQ